MSEWGDKGEWGEGMRVVKSDSAPGIRCVRNAPRGNTCVRAFPGGTWMSQWRGEEEWSVPIGREDGFILALGPLSDVVNLLLQMASSGS